MKLIAKTFQGIEKVLYDELSKKNFKKPTIHIRAVSFEGDLFDLYRANYTLSTALRILMLLKSEKITNEIDLYKFLYSIKWNDFFSVNKSFRVDVTLTTNRFSNSLFLAQKAKDAIVDRFRKEINIRPSVDTLNPDVIIHIHINEKETNVYLDSSGETLNKRGYKHYTSEAPLNEVMARGLIKLAKWDAKTPLLDIMCGSGTIPIEAHYDANNIPAGFLRKHYSFMNWNNFEKSLWEKVIYEENYKIKENFVNIIGLDINKFVILNAKKNIKRLPFLDNITFNQRDFLDKPYSFSNGIIISNIPYNERIQINNVQNFYRKIGDMLKFNYSTNSVWLLVKKDVSKYISLKPKIKIPLLNGKIECTFNYYPLY